MPPQEPARPTDTRLLLYVGMGLLLGAVFVCFDVVAEARLANGTLTGALAEAHAAIDHTLPILVGGLLGISAHYLRVRSELAVARDAASRAEALRERLQKVERDQAVWVLAASVLHELVNPLHALGLLVDELALSPAPDETRDLTTRARAQMDRALRELDLLRSMEKKSEPELGPLELHALLEGLASDIGSLASRTVAVRVLADGPVTAHADASYVRTILENLIGNSLHALADRPRGVITLRLSVVADRAVVLVTDDGPPLDAAVAATLFEPLRTTKSLGLGLGLPIAKALARTMRGDLTFAQTAEKTFRLELPTAPPPP